MRILITIMLLWSSTIAFGQEIWQLSPWAPDSTYVIGAMNNGEPTWVKVDSLTTPDSIYLSGDNVKLRDGAGVAQLPTASTSTKGLLTSTDWNTFNGKVGGSGVATRVAFWNGSNTLNSTSGFEWNATVKRLRLDGVNRCINIGDMSGNMNQGTDNINIGLYNGNGFGGPNNNNISIGNQNYWASSIGTNNITIGRANYIYGNGSYNVCIGDGVNSGNPATGSNNVYIGRAIAKLGGHSENVGLGFLTLNNLTDGTRNVGNGSYSLFDLTTGSENLGLGFYAGSGLTTGSSNVGIGSYSLAFCLNSSIRNVAIGTYALANSTGSEMVAIGMNSARYQGNNTTAIGSYSFGSMSGYGNVGLGFLSGYLETGNNKLYIENSSSASPLIGGQFDTDRVGINKNINSINSTLHVGGDITIDTRIGTPAKMAAFTSAGVLCETTLPTTGTVISVGINTGGGVTSVSGSPVTGSGNISLTLADQSASNELQNLSFTSPNLSISGGNSVALPLLPSGSSTQTLAYIGGAWSASSFLKTNSTTTSTGNLKRVDINNDVGGESWAGTLNTATKFLVNGRVQMNSTSSTSVTSILGRNGDNEVGTVTVSDGMDLSGGLLSAESINYAQLIKDGGFTITLPGTGSTNATKIDFATASGISGYNTSSSTNDNITILSSNVGVYEIEYDLSLQPGGSNTEYSVQVYKNSTALSGTRSIVGINQSSYLNTYIPVSKKFITSLSNNDVLDLRIYTSNNTSVAYQMPNFIIKRVK